MIPRLKANLGLKELRTALTPTGNRAEAVGAFEQAFAKQFHARNAIAMPYGRTGLMLLLNAMGIKGDEVLCPAYTCLVVPEAIALSGNRPVFVDCCARDYNIDFDLLDKAVGQNTKALIATSIFGHPLDLDKLDAFRARHSHIRIIQDCAHSFDASWNDRSVMSAGDAAFFGLNISKIMTSVFGGMVTTDNDALATNLRRVCDERLYRPGMVKSLKRRLYLLAIMGAFIRPIYGLVNALERARFLDRFTVYHTDTEVLTPPDCLEAMGGFEARVGSLQTKTYPVSVAHRRLLAQCYHDDLASLASDDFVLPPDDAGATYSHFVIRTPHAAALIKHCRTRGVQLGTLIDYHCPDNASFSKDRAVGPRRAAAWPGHIINLPVHTGMSEKDVSSIARMVRDIVTECRAKQSPFPPEQEM